MKYIGSGSYGEIWLSKHDKSNAKYAIKKLLTPKILLPIIGNMDYFMESIPEFFENSMYRFQELKEIMASQLINYILRNKISHHFVPTYSINVFSKTCDLSDHGIFERYHEEHENILDKELGCVNIVLPYFEMGDLLNFLCDRKNQNVELINNLIFQIMCALTVLHSMNKIHGDLHCGNVLISRVSIKKYTHFEYKINNVLFRIKNMGFYISLIDFGRIRKINNANVIFDIALLYNTPKIINDIYKRSKIDSKFDKDSEKLFKVLLRKSKKYFVEKPADKTTQETFKLFLGKHFKGFIVTEKLKMKTIYTDCDVKINLPRVLQNFIDYSSL
jgi:serine/threonine protein kinase